MKKKEFFTCPHCGAELSVKATACPECGSDESTGWSDKTYLDGLGLPDDDEYEELYQSEFKEKKNKKLGWVTLTGIIILVIFILLILRNAM